jgi:3-deoxy-manno-octulosonate cytidylyltransferase (CMP-KDO synthetase)
MNTTIFIPARLHSNRLPKKLLQPIGNKPMLQHVIDRAKDSDIKDVIVATDSVEIMSAIKDNDVQCVMTSKEHTSGSDRIYEALSKIDPEKNIQYVINLQGDLPFIDPNIINKLRNKALKSEADILTLASPIDSKNIGKIADKNVTKVAISFYDEKQSFGKGVYFSRQPIPHDAPTYYEHVGIYLYKRKALEKFVNSDPDILEKQENLEQLRALSSNMSIDVYVIDNPPINVDTQEGLKKAQKEYEEKYKISV